MKITLNVLLVTAFLFSCKSKGEVTPTPIPPSVKPEIDFTQTKFFTIEEVLACKTIEDCATMHYWTNKSLNMQGYISYVDNQKRIFTLHSSLNYGAGSTVSGNIKINPKDSVAIAEKLNRYLDKKIFVKTICTSGQVIVSKCEETLIPEVMSANDIDIK
jgi:hypothetical protein